MIAFNNNWEFTPVWNELFAKGEGDAETVRIPHTVKELPLHYIDHKEYQMISGYRKSFVLPEEARGSRCFIEFGAAAHIATVYVNGMELMTHKCGYTAFRVEFTDVARFGEENLVTVRLDSTENPEIPPFGYVIDYLTYGGIYRPVYLDIRNQDLIDDVFVRSVGKDQAKVTVTLDTKTDNYPNLINSITVLALSFVPSFCITLEI